MSTFPSIAALPSASSPSVPSPSQSPLVLKVRYVSTGDCRRFPLPVSPPLSFPALLSCVSSLFSLPVSRLQLQWRDEEADMVTVASEDEWQRLQRDARDRQQKVLQLSVVEDGLLQPPTQHLQQQQLSSKSSPSAESVHGPVSSGAWQRDVQAILAQHSMVTSSLNPSPAHTRQQYEERKDTVIEQQPHQRPFHPPPPLPPPPPPPQPQQQQSPPQLTLSSPLSCEASSLGSSDDESPVLIDGSNLPSASDSHVASALWKRHKYKAQQSLNQRRNSQLTSQMIGLTLPTTVPVPPTLRLGSASSAATAFKSARKPQLQLAVPAASASSLPSSPQSRSPPSSVASPSLQTVLSHHLEKARSQLKFLLPTSLLSCAAPSASLGSRSSSKLSASIAAEQARNERIAAAYALLSSFIGDGNGDEDDVSRDEVLSRCIALFVYTRKYLSDKKQRNDELAAQLGHVDLHRRDEEELEADKRRQLLNEAQRHGLRSLSSSVPISASCSPALVTVMAIIHQHLASRLVTDVPATLELFGAVLADLTAQVHREENRETRLKQMQHNKQAERQEQKESMSHPTAAAAASAVVNSDEELVSSLSRLPAALRDTVRALLIDCVHYAEAGAGANPGLAFSSLASHSFAATLHTFRTDYQDMASDELPRQRTARDGAEQPVIVAAQHSERDDDVKDSSVDYSSSQQPQHSLGSVHRQQSVQPAALFDVGRDDVMLSDRKIMKAVAKAMKKERKEKKADEKRRRKASRGKSSVSATLQQSVDDEEHELHELLSQMNNTKQQQQPSTLSVSNDSLAALVGCGRESCGASCVCPAAPSVDVDGWQLYPQSTPSQPADSPASAVDASSPFSYQPFPYTLSSKQQQQQQQLQSTTDEQPDKSSFASLPAPHHAAATAAATVPLRSVSHPTPSADPTHFPSLPFAVPPPLPASVPASASSSVSSSVAVSVPQPSFASVVSSHGSASSVDSSAAAVHPRRLTSLLQSLHVMGFKDDSLNSWLLQRNGYDLNQTVEWLIVQSEVGLD